MILFYLNIKVLNSSIVDIMYVFGIMYAYFLSWSTFIKYNMA